MSCAIQRLACHCTWDSCSAYIFSQTGHLIVARKVWATKAASTGSTAKRAGRSDRWRHRWFAGNAGSGQRVGGPHHQRAEVEGEVEWGDRRRATTTRKTQKLALAYLHLISVMSVVLTFNRKSVLLLQSKLKKRGNCWRAAKPLSTSSKQKQS